MEQYRKDFPILEKVTYLDSACMSLKPKQVIDKIKEYYEEYPGCGGRGVHSISKKVLEELNNTRRLVKKFINAGKEEEIIFTKNTTESINLVLNNPKIIKILISDREHNSNLLPCLRHQVIVVPSKKDYSFDLEKFQEYIKDVDFVSMVWTSNIDGYTLPVKEIVKIAHENDVLVHLDGAQEVPHKEVNVKKLGVDFLSFSGHKMLGPTGVGVLYGRIDLLKKLIPLVVGGGTVVDSTYKDYKFEEVPMRLESGLQNYSGIIGFSEAIKYLNKVGMKNIEEYEIKLKKLINKDGLEIIGYNGDRGIFNFNISEMDSHEVAVILDSSKKIMVRSGRHCCHSWYNKNNINGSARASLYFYNSKKDIEILNEEVRKLLRFN